MYNILILVFTVLLTGSMAANAQTAASMPPPASANSANTPDDAVKTPAGKFVADLGASAVKVVADKSLSVDQRQQQYRDLLHSSFDMTTIGHFVIGRAWNAAAPEQQQEFMKLFEQVVLKTYGDRLNFYSGENFRVKGVRSESEKDSIVNSEITHPDGSPPTKIDWRVRNQNGKLAIIDVVVEGVSQSVTQRDEYGAIIQRDGGKLDGLIALMRKQAQDPNAQQNP